MTDNIIKEALERADKDRDLLIAIIEFLQEAWGEGESLDPDDAALIHAIKTQGKDAHNAALALIEKGKVKYHVGELGSATLFYPTEAFEKDPESKGVLVIPLEQSE